jgi:hypothetical protein
MTFRPALLRVAVALVPLLHTAPAWPQPADTKISGTVRDATGIGIPAATVTAINRATTDSQTATTTSDGGYTLAIPPGAYEVTASFPGFRSLTQAIEIGTRGSTEADFLLQPVLSEAVTVTAMKRDETIFNVPFSVAAPTEQVLRARGVEDIEGVAANVGGFTVQNLGPGQS